ncbi:conserved Plasmodium protein, unknown function [Plasmodium knowlesi strain H]|uniref:Uncharacterized protein n=3 Tax=Plasmodium knowlesi TaxID=5850 RepID=A0A5K1UQK2_PLAKH|nr:WD repeat-containing protein, putative [Plasmodium knowlesi strain H]CAA9990981.1 WD repeat-containing protein, putative [Plasmodium knowlesi strain H]SBO20766.1 conserved Plasmodium protein, unknown function [Plasmodium knowlesi strain H]SBO21218.1 conserved Plasmodium protein, unknown function [Plasmodium knowlesi strain H]VVS80455.1 WD repeat-containing protein, putative [Plasmodium knowlesi strain H]|eukprot:XP_002262264.1 hypothetical protein, conserved in Plasmodium species [Plasmodium knowlesi strain H]
MKKEFKEYNEKNFRNIQFIYDFLDKTGMKNSVEALKNESKINYVRDYDKYFLENGSKYEADEYTNNPDEKVADNSSNVPSDNRSDSLSDNLSDDFEIDRDFFIHTIEKMKNTALCKAIDIFECALKSSNSSCKDAKEKEKKKMDSAEKGNCFQNGETFPDYKNFFTESSGDNFVGMKKEHNAYSQDNVQNDCTNIGEYIGISDKIENQTKGDMDNHSRKAKDGCILKKLAENLKDISSLSKNHLKFPSSIDGKLRAGVSSKHDLTPTGKPNDEVDENTSKYEAMLDQEKSSIGNFPYMFESVEGAYSSCEKGKNYYLSGKKSKSMNGEGGRTVPNNAGTDSHNARDVQNWDSFFTYEREICRELKVKYSGGAKGKNENNNGDDNYIGSTSNILVVKYVDIYNLDTCQNMRFENIIFFKHFFPILLLVGYADGNVKLLLILYEKSDNENNAEECIHIIKELDHLSLSSPIMFIDINYKDNIFIVSTMNGDIFICKINMSNLSILTENVELNHSIDDIKKNVRTDERYISIIRNLTYHNKYSIKCVFNQDYSLFCSIANDKNLIIYEKITSENDMSVIYEKKKVIGLPQVPTSVLWVKENNNKEMIITSMLSSNHVLCINSKTYNVVDKIYLFEETDKYNILNLEYNKNKNILVICTDTSIIFVYSFISKSIIRKIYGCVLNSLSFPTIEVDINGNNIYITSDDKANGTHILIFDIKSGNIIDAINNGYKIRCFQLLKSYICPFSSETNSNNIEENKKSLLILGSFDKKIHFYSN